MPYVNQIDMANSVLLAYDATSLGIRIPTFRDNLMSSSGIEQLNSSWKFRPLKTRTVCLAETSYPIIRAESSAVPPGNPQTPRKLTCLRIVLGLLASEIRGRRNAQYWSVQLCPHVRCTRKVSTLSAHMLKHKQCESACRISSAFRNTCR